MAETLEQSLAVERDDTGLSIDKIVEMPEPLQWDDQYTPLFKFLISNNQRRVYEPKVTRKLVKSFVRGHTSIRDYSPFFVKDLAKAIHTLSIYSPTLTDILARHGNLAKLLTFYETAIQQLGTVLQGNDIGNRSRYIITWAHLNENAAKVARALYFREPEHPDTWKRLKRAKQWYDYEHKTDSIKNRVGQSDSDPLYYAFSYRSRAIAAYCIHMELSKRRHSPPTKKWQQQILNRKDEWYSIFEGCMAEALRLGKVASAIPTRIEVASAFLEKTQSFETTYDLNIVSHKL